MVPCADQHPVQRGSFMNDQKSSTFKGSPKEHQSIYSSKILVSTFTGRRGFFSQFSPVSSGCPHGQPAPKLGAEPPKQGLRSRSRHGPQRHGAVTPGVAGTQRPLPGLPPVGTPALTYFSFSLISRADLLHGQATTFPDT